MFRLCSNYLTVSNAYQPYQMTGMFYEVFVVLLAGHTNKIVGSIRSLTLFFEAKQEKQQIRSKLDIAICENQLSH